MARKSKGMKPSINDYEDFTNDLGWVDPKFLFEVIKHVGIYVYDIETTGLNPRKDRLDGIAFYVPAGSSKDFGELGYYDGEPIRAWYPFNPFSFMCHIYVRDIPSLEPKLAPIGVDMQEIYDTAKDAKGSPRHPDELILVDLRPPMDQESTMEALRPIWTDLTDVVGITHHGKFDSGFLWVCPGTAHPIRINNVWGDSMLADFCSDERRRRYGLKIRVKQEFNHQMTPYAEAVRGQSLLAFCNAKPLGVYAMDDCYWEYRLHQRSIEKLRTQEPPPTKRTDLTWSIEKKFGRVMGRLERVYWGIDTRISEILMEMQESGVLIDWQWLQKVNENIIKEKEEISRRLEEFLGWPINPNATGQVADALFASPPDGLGLPERGIPIGKTGDPSTSDKVIKHFARFHPLVADILKWRSLDTIQGGFVTKLIKLAVESPDGRVYAHFNQTRTVIARLCVAAGTLIEVVRDVSKYPKGIPIENVKPGALAYTYDKDLNLTLQRVKNVWKTGHRQVYRIHWRGGNGQNRQGHLDVTPEHPIRLTDGSYIRADALKPGDRVMALSRGVSKEGYARLYATGHAPLNREHRFIYEQVHPEFSQENVVHHEDGNKLNNNAENLLDIPQPEHTELHAREMWERPEVRESVVNAIIERWKDPIYRAKHTARMRKWWQEGKFQKPSGRDHPQFKEIPREWMEDVLWAAGGRVSVFAKRFGINHDRAKRFLEEYGIDRKTIRLLHRDDGKLITYEEVERARTLTQREALTLIGKGYYKFRELQEFYGFEVPFNHTIIKVEPLANKVDVYDLEIENTHNFIASEICVHNSSSDPINFQNQPRDKNLVRKAYVSCRKGIETDDPDMRLYGADYGQIELRVAAHLSQEENMIEVYQMGGICLSENGGPCKRYTFYECQDCDACCPPVVKQGVNLCGKCGSPKVEHQARCKHVDLHQRTAENAGVKRNPLAKNCVTGDSMVLTEHGLLRIDEIVTEEGRVKKTIGIMSDDGRVRQTESVFGGGVQPVADVNLEYGLKVTATLDHEFFVMRGGKVERIPVEKLQPGDPVLIMAGRDVHGSEIALPTIEMEARTTYKDVDLPRFLTAEVARFLGYFVSEGRQESVPSRGYYQVQFGFSETESRGMIEDFVPCMQTLVGDRYNEWSKDGSVHFTITSKKLNAWFDLLGMGYASGDKVIPACVRRAPWSLKREFFRALFEGDGTSKSSGEDDKCRVISYTSKSEELIRQIQAEMMNVNILGYVSSETRPTQKGRQRYWVWTIRRQSDLARFSEMVGFISKRKQGRMEQLLIEGITDRSNRFLDGVEPLLETIYDKVKRKQKDKLREVIRREKNPVRFGDARVSLLANVLPEEINSFVDAGIWTAKVRSVVDAGEAEVYDLYEPERTAMVVNSCVILDCNFGLLYRMGAPKFCVYADLFDADGMPMISYAKEIIARWHAAYPAIALFHEATEYNLTRNGWIAKTLFGRRRRLDQEARINRFRAVTQGIQFMVSGCVAPETPILTESGYVSINRLAESRLAIFDGDGFTSNYGVFETGEKEVFEVKLSDGRTLECSGDHRLAGMDCLEMSWPRVKDLKKGDLVATHDVLAPQGDPDHGATPDEAYLVGALIGDGYYGSSHGFTLAASAKDPGWPESLDASVRAAFGGWVGPRMRWGLRKTPRNGLVKDLVVHSSRARSALMVLGLDCISKQKKRIPEWVYTAPPEVRGACLAGLVDTDGSVLGYKQNNCFALRVNYASRVKHLVEGAWRLASSLGIDAAIRTLDVKSTSKKGGRTKQYRLDITYRGLRAFRRWVPLRHPRKAAALEGALTLIAKNPPRRRLPISFVQSVAALANATPIMASQQGGSPPPTTDRRLRRRVQSYIGHAHHGNAGENMVAAILDYIKEPGAKEALQLGWVAIESIRSLGVRPTFDIEIHGENHAYIANGFLTHNSAQDIMKTAMVRIYEDRNRRRDNARPAERKLWNKVRLLLQIHDELVIEGPRQLKAEITEMFKEGMEGVGRGALRVPLAVDVKSGTTWDHIH